MVPVMLLARKIDSEDPVMVYRIRMAYAIVQVVSVLVVLYTYVVARSAAFSKKNDHANQIIYVPPPATVRMCIYASTRALHCYRRASALCAQSVKLFNTRLTLLCPVSVWLLVRPCVRCLLACLLTYCYAACDPRPLL